MSPVSPPRPFLKVCGITRAEDADALAALGVDALGFILAPESPRRVSLKEAAAILRETPSGPARVGVTVNAAPETVREAVRRLGLDAIQAHGEESPATCAAYGVPVVKAVRTRPGLRAEDLEPYRGFPLLLDGFRDRARGGTGHLADWTLAGTLVEAGFTLLLAGGLDPSNLARAIETVGPAGVDLNSGVERSPGVKDVARVRRALAILERYPRSEERKRPW